MSPADKYKEELAENIWFRHYMDEKDSWEYAILCVEQDRVGYFIPKELI